MRPLIRRLESIVRCRREAGIATAGVVAIGFVMAIVGFQRATPAWPSTAARVEPFLETIVEPGSIVARQMTLYSSTISAGPSKILELAPEGKAVAPGDLLIRFDASPFDQTRAREQAALRQAEADLTRAVEDTRLEMLRAQEDLEASAQQIANAERSVANQAQGAGQVVLLEAEASAAEAQRELARARKNVDDLKPLLAENFITRAEFVRAEQALQRAEDQQRVAIARQESIVKFERPAAASRAHADLSAAYEKLTRQKESVTARAAQRKAVLTAARSRVDEIRARVDMLTDQIDRATIRATGPGLVVHRDLFFGTERRKPQIGDEAAPGQPVIAVPDSSQLLVEARVRETDLHKLAPNQRVHVRVAAYPDLRLPASVSLIGALAQEDAARAGTKFFPITVTLDAGDARLRTGMTARIEIEVASIASAVVLPAQAVFSDDGKPYVVCLEGSRPVRRTVTVAAANETLVAIAAGVGGGDSVLLVDPTASAANR